VRSGFACHVALDGTSDTSHPRLNRRRIWWRLLPAGQLTPFPAQRAAKQMSTAQLAATIHRVRALTGIGPDALHNPAASIPETR